MKPCWAGAALAALLLGGCYNRAADVAELARRHAVAAGRVVILDCANQGRWWYEFGLNGKRRRGMASDPSGCVRRQLGDAVTVYYNPAQPDVHRAIAPAKAYEAEHGFYLPLWLWFAIGALALPLSAWMALKRGAPR